MPNDTNNDERGQLHLNQCHQFVAVTDTNTAVAMSYLQDWNWDLELAVSAYFEDHNPLNLNSGHPANDFIDLTDSDDPPDGGISGSSSDPKTLDILSWNIDGLDSPSFPQRLSAIVSIIKHELPHVVCLQEVTAVGLAELRATLTDTYHIMSATDDPLTECIHYFVAILIRNHHSISIDKPTFTVTPFPSSSMGRHLVSVDTMIDRSLWNTNKGAKLDSPVRLRVYTSHLESCGTSSSKRKAQLKDVWNRMISSSPHSDCESVFCGDLNLRDHEISQLGGLPHGINDVWENVGSRTELRCTWDPRRNTNAGRYGMYGPKKASQTGLRFDRMYWTGCVLKAVDFGLRGLEKIPRTTFFPSDHWGILGRFVLR